MGKRAIDIGDFVRDVQAGASDADLMEKYEITREILLEIYQKLVEMGRISASHLTRGASESDDLDVTLASTCPRCGALLLADSGECGNCLAERVAQLIDEKEKYPIKTKEHAGSTPDEKRAEPPKLDSPVVEASEPVPDKGLPLKDADEPLPQPTRTKRPKSRALKPQRKRMWPMVLGGVFLTAAIVAGILWYVEAIELPVSPWRAAPGPPPAEKTVPLRSTEIAPKAPVAPERDVPAPKELAAEKRQDPQTRESPVALPPEKTIDRENKTDAAAPEAGTRSEVESLAEQAGPPVQAQPLPASPGVIATEPPVVPPGTDEPGTDRGTLPRTAAVHPAAPPVESRESLVAPEFAATTEPAEGKRVSGTASDTRNLLPTAVRESNIEQVKHLLDGGMDINSVDEDGSSLLTIAARSGNEPMVDLLLGRGADGRTRDRMGFTPLARACELGNARIVNLLLRRDKEKGASELLEASEKGRVTWVKLMLDQGANVNVKNDAGATPLMVAAGKGQLELVRLLLNRGADTTAQDVKGFTALAWAFSPSSMDVTPFPVQREIIRLLKHYGK